MVYEMLLSRYNAVELEGENEQHGDRPQQVTQISDTEVPGEADFTERNRVMVLAALFGLCAPILLAWGFEMRTTRFYHLSQFPIMFPNVSMETIGGMPRPGLAAVYRGKKRRNFQQSIEELCHSFCYGKHFEGMKVFLLSSVRKDDGQALIAVNLAEKMAKMQQQPVLLIDTFGGNARLRQLMGMEGKGGLADVLQMRLGMNDAIIRDSEQPFLYFLPDAENANVEAAEIFSDGKFDMLLSELKKHYSAIILSAPPFQASSVAYSLTSHADAVVIAIRLYDTYKTSTEEVFERLETLGTPVTSFVISGITDERFA
jgi:Mrp family chromosome partitioning ATPase